ncbi:hypothetical protein LWI29_018800 [Acer saccharum]|uniref:Uncharacterized protein n=1 Tax=Acer saccharum TaxID=4024 RepID=A0AA39VTE2_ACESA|nr:hypothetical protein LWI29_018800 [Acer saccharum]
MEGPMQFSRALSTLHDTSPPHQITNDIKLYGTHTSLAFETHFSRENMKYTASTEPGGAKPLLESSFPAKQIER